VNEVVAAAFWAFIGYSRLCLLLSLHCFCHGAISSLGLSVGEKTIAHVVRQWNRRTQNASIWPRREKTYGDI
jgi:hypothetical protein